MELRAARVRVPASTSNLGAGFDALGLAFDRYLTVELFPGPDRVEADADDYVASCFVSALRTFGFGDVIHGTFRTRSDIPVGRGLGSSAAARVAGIALAHAVAEKPLDRDVVFAEACRAEGHPDNAAPAVFGGLRASAPCDGGFHSFELPLSAVLGFAFAAPSVAVRTSDARAALPAEVPHALATRNAARAFALAHGLATGDPELLRIGFNDELHVPHRLPLIPRGREALQAALDTGAYAATISGSGSGLIAVCAPDNAACVAGAMTAAFGDGGFGFDVAPDREGVVIQ